MPLPTRSHRPLITETIAAGLALLLTSAVAWAQAPTTPTVSATSGPPAAAAPVASVDGDTVLKAIDQRATSFGDLSYTATMKILGGGDLKRTLEFEMVIKGLDRQYIAFTRPGDVAGMKILLTGVDSMWMYSPEFKKVRKVAAHMRRQGFLGSEFTPEDMATSHLAERFTATITASAAGMTTLVLRPRPGVEASFDHLELTIEAAKGGVTKVRYFDASGKALREQTRDAWKMVGKIPVPTRISMKNLVNGNETQIELSAIRADTGVPDDFFSKRTLLRGTSAN